MNCSKMLLFEKPKKKYQRSQISAPYLFIFKGLFLFNDYKLPPWLLFFIIPIIPLLLIISFFFLINFISKSYIHYVIYYVNRFKTSTSTKSKINE